MAKAKKMFAIIALFVLGPALLVMGAKDWKRVSKLREHGKTTVGKVTEASYWKRKFSKDYYIRAEYAVAEQRFSEKFEVSEGDYERARAERTITVHYLPDEPTVAAAGTDLKHEYMFLLTGAAMLLGAVFLIVSFKQPMDEQEAAENIAAETAVLCIGQHEYAPADPKKFPHIDHAWLNRSQQELESLGFRFLQDVEDLTLARKSGVKTFLRNHVSRDGSMMATLYHFKPGFLIRMLGGKDARVLDVETQFSNGEWICTGNAEAAGALQSPPGVDTLQMPAGTAIQTVLQAHQTRVTNKLARTPNIRPVTVSTIEDVLRAQNELQAIKADFRKQHGVSKAELEKVAGSSSPELDTIHAEAERLRSPRIVLRS